MMAYTQKPLFYVCRSRTASAAQAFKSNRAFSGTTKLRKTLVEFSPTSSPELDAIFNEYREKLFIPSVLSEDHRRLIYRPSKDRQLLNDPGVTVTLPNDEDLKLKPMLLHDRPAKTKTINEIRDILATTQDDSAWNNLVSFLEGMRVAREPIRTRYLQQITRKAYEQGKYNIPQRCAELAKRTDFRLCYPGLAVEIFLGCHRRAAAAGFEGDELLAASKQAEYIALILEREEHCGGKLKDNEVDARTDLMVVGTLLELASAKAVHLDASKDLDGQVAGYVTKSLALFHACDLKPTASEEPYNMPKKEWEKFFLAKRGQYLLKMIPLWHGMKLASRVEGAVAPESADRFNQALNNLEKNITTAEADCRQAESHQPTRALSLFDQVQSLQR